MAAKKQQYQLEFVLSYSSFSALWDMISTPEGLEGVVCRQGGEDRKQRYSFRMGRAATDCQHKKHKNKRICPFSLGRHTRKILLRVQTRQKRTNRRTDTDNNRFRIPRRYGRRKAAMGELCLQSVSCVGYVIRYLPPPYICNLIRVITFFVYRGKSPFIIHW